MLLKEIYCAQVAKKSLANINDFAVHVHVYMRGWLVVTLASEYGAKRHCILSGYMYTKAVCKYHICTFQ